MNKLLLVCLLALAPVSLASADFKIAVIDLSKAFDNYYKTKDCQALLKQHDVDFQKKVDPLVAEYQHMGDELQALDKAANDPTLAPQSRQDKATAVNAKKQDYYNLQVKLQEMVKEHKGELQEEYFKRKADIVNEITKVISDYSGPQGYDLVLDKNAVSAASGVPIFLYNSSKLIDITADIIKLLNQSAPASSGAAPSGAALAPAAPANH